MPAVPHFGLEKFKDFCYLISVLRSLEIAVDKASVASLQGPLPQMFKDFCWQCQHCLISVLRSLEISVNEASIASLQGPLPEMFKDFCWHWLISVLRSLEISVNKASIASLQGPLPETFGDFWRMVWEQRGATVVMMTKLEERSRVSDFFLPEVLLDAYSAFSWTCSACSPDRYMHCAAAGEAASYSELWLPP